MTVTEADAEQKLRDSLQLSPLDDIDQWLNILAYGDPGSGKTHLLGTASDFALTSPVVIFDIDGGLKTLKKFPNKDNITRKIVRSMPGIIDGYNLLYKSIQTREDGSQFIPGVNTVGLDSGTELTDLDMRTIMDDAYSRNPDKVDKDVPSQREWGKARAHMRSIIRAFRDLPCNFIMTAHVGTLQEENQPTKYFPGFAGKLRTEVPGFFDIVGYLSTRMDGGNTIRQFQTLGSTRVVAKDRSGLLGDMLRGEDVTIPHIWELVNS